MDPKPLKTRFAEPTLYILMRNDLESLNPGKGMAQAAHAANMFVWTVQGSHYNEDVRKLFEMWEESTPQNFGTTIVLSTNEREMRLAETIASGCGYPSGVVNDPTYPVTDGDVTHAINIDTCAFVFGDRRDPLLRGIVGNFSLYR